MAIGDREFGQVAGARDEDTLNKIYAFSQTGEQDESNERLRRAIQGKLEQVRAENQRKQLQEQLMNEAKQYRESLPQIQEQQYGVVADQARKDLSDQTRQIRGQANRRGLLYSGQRLGAESGARSQVASNLAQQRANINQQTISQANEMEQRAQQSGLQGAQEAQQRSNDAYMTALKNRQQSGLAQQALGGALGGIGGAFIGKASGSK